MTVTILFTHTLGDLDMRLYYTDCSTEIDSSTSTTDNEQVVYNTAIADGTYNVRIYGYGGDEKQLRHGGRGLVSGSDVHADAYAANRADGHPDAYADPHTDQDAYTDADTDQDTHADADTDRDGYTDADTDQDTHADADTNRDGYTDEDSDEDGHANVNRHSAAAEAVSSAADETLRVPRATHLGGALHVVARHVARVFPPAQPTVAQAGGRRHLTARAKRIIISPSDNGR